jgi:ABC-type nitrate/sulfonate/bicarbonate transport system permease component
MRAARSGVRRARSGLIGVVVVVAGWWLLADTAFRNVGVSPKGGGGSVPTPARVIHSIFQDGWSFYWPNLKVTLLEAVVGYVAGNLVALALAGLVMVVPRLHTVVSQIAVLTYCIPIVAIGPILRVVITAPQPGQPAGTAEFLAAMLVFFTTVVGALLGLGAADKASLDVIAVYGGGRFAQLRKVRMIAAVPSVLAALKIAAPLAFLGALLGEYLGGVDVGLGPALINAQQTLEIPRTWGIALVAGVVSLLGYALVGGIGRLAAPWSTSAKRAGS